MILEFFSSTFSPPKEFWKKKKKINVLICKVFFQCDPLRLGGLFVLCVFVLFFYSFSGMEQTTPMEETAETAEQTGTSEGEPLNKYSLTKIFSL